MEKRKQVKNDSLLNKKFFPDFLKFPEFPRGILFFPLLSVSLR